MSREPKPKSRANGEGSIYEERRKGAVTGRWIAEIVVGLTPDGKKKVMRHYAPSQKKARTWLTEQLKDRDDGILVDPSKDTLSKWLATWVKTIAAHSVKQSTLAHYEKIVATYVDPYIGGVTMDKLMPFHVQTLYHELISRKLSGRTVRHVHNCLHRALGVAKTIQMVKINVTAHVEPPKVVKQQMKVLDPEQAARFLEEARGDRLYPLYLLAVQLGMRIGEIMGLRWEDIDFREGTLTVNQTLINVKGRMAFDTPKTKMSQRTLDIPAHVLSILKKWKIEQNREKLRLGDAEAWAHPELVFSTQIGTPLHSSNLRTRSFNVLLERAGCPRIRIHDLRHTALTHMGRMGLGPKEIQEIAGHSDVSVTFGIYGHTFREQKKAAAQKIDDFWQTAHTKAR